MIISAEGFADNQFWDWADRMTFLTNSQELFTKTLDTDSWQDWASTLIGTQDHLGQDTPDPLNYTNWKDWANDLFRTQEFSA